MNINLKSILPDDISDETAYYLFEVFNEISNMLSGYYYRKRIDYINNNLLKAQDDSQLKIDFENTDTDPF